MFEDFITQSNLFDVPLRGSFFTWYRPDETCKSKLDRALINEEWIEKWPGVVLKGIDRLTSDHYPILLHINFKDWGPKPFQFSIFGRHTRISFRLWRINGSYEVEGWTGFVLKEKLKRVRNDLKIWNKDVVGHMIQTLTQRRRDWGFLTE